MKELFNFIKAKINTAVPAIKTVRLWNNQTGREKDTKNEMPVKFPALFIEIIVSEDIKNLSLGIKDVPLIIRCRFALEGYKFERLSDLDFQKTFDSFIQNFRGNPSDTVQFSTLQEQMTDLDEDSDQVNEPFIDYRTIWRKQSAYPRSTDIVTGEDDVTPVVTGEQL